MEIESEFEIVHLQILNEKFEKLQNNDIQPKCDLSDVNIMRARDIPPSFYRHIYNEVGEIVYNIFLSIKFTYLILSGSGMIGIN